MIKIPLNKLSDSFMTSLPDQDFNHVENVEDIRTMISDEIDQIVEKIESHSIKAEVVKIPKVEEEDYPAWIHVGWVSDEEDFILIVYNNDAMPELLEEGGVQKFWTEWNIGN